MSDGGQMAIHFLEESTWGTTPSSNMDKLAAPTSESLKFTVQSDAPAVIRDDYINPRITRRSTGTDGGIQGILANGDIDTFMEGALRGAWGSAVSVSASDISFTASTQTISRATGSWVTDGVDAGCVLLFAGASNSENNGYMYVTSVAASDLVVVGMAQDIVDEAAGQAITAVHNGFLSNGTSKKSYTIEKYFADLTTTPYEVYTGMRVGELGVTAQSGSDVTWSLTFAGKSMAQSGSSAGNGTINSAVTAPLMSSTGDVSGILEGGSAVSVCVSQLDFTIGGGTRPINCVGQTAPGAIGLNNFSVTGNLNIYRDDAAQAYLDKYTGETQSSLLWRSIDTTGAGYAFVFPRIKYTDGSGNDSGANSDISVNLQWGAELDDSGTGILVGITRFA